MSKFNDKQQRAISTTEGRVRVIAGAGSGKTSVLTERYAEIIKSGVKPEEILCVTFTNKAADEMKERIEKKLNINMKTSLIKTFHGFCYMLLRENISSLGWGSKFNILDSSDQNTLLRNVYEDLKSIQIKVERSNDENPIKDISKGLPYSKAISLVSEMKTETEEALDLFIIKSQKIKELYDELRRDVLRIKVVDLTNPKQLLTLKSVLYYGYLYYQIDASGLDFNDLIIFGVKLLQTDKEYREKWQNRLKYVMVDEFQDASYRQSTLVEILTEKSNNLFVVGDPDQTIYSWRGAKPKILVEFDKEKETDTIIMNQNYRSTPTILNAANNVIENNELRVPKDLFTENEDGDTIKCCTFLYHDTGAKWVANKIETLINSGKYSPKDFAILYRNKASSLSPEKALRNAHIPYIVYSGISFYEREEIKDMLSYLRVVNDVSDNMALSRILNKPVRGVGRTGLKELQESSKLNKRSLWDTLIEVTRTENTKRAKTIGEFIFMISGLRQKYLNGEITIPELTEQLYEQSNYESYLNKDIDGERKDHIKELIESQVEMLSQENWDLDEYLANMALMASTDKKSGDCVSLMTAHASKGLEFPVVFLFNMNEGIFPSSRATTEEMFEEERRLMYVSITRAKEKLFLIHVKQDRDPVRAAKISSFVKEMGDENIEFFEDRSDENRSNGYNNGYLPNNYGYRNNYGYNRYSYSRY